MPSKYYYHLPLSKSPSFQLLAKHLSLAGWSPTRLKWRAQFSEANCLFDINTAEHLEYKHLLADLVQKHCPTVMPNTYRINDVNWPQVLNEITEKWYTNNNLSTQQTEKPIWILKPSLLNNGQFIHIFQNTNEIERHYLSTNRLGGEHVLQQYLSHPHLLQGPKLGHKYSVRLFVVITNYAGCFVYPDGYFNIALRPYPGSDFHDLQPHLTNEHLSHETANVVQIPTFQYELFKPFYPKMKDILLQVFTALEKEHPHAFQPAHIQTLSLFGFDFMMDDEERVWLLEANHGPCFPVAEDHPLQQTLYHPFWQAVLQDFVFPIAQKNKKPRYSYFDKIT